MFFVIWPNPTVVRAAIEFISAFLNAFPITFLLLGIFLLIRFLYRCILIAISMDRGD